MALGRDGNLVVLDLLDEDPADYEISSSLELFDNGHVSGELDAPANNEVRVLTFNGVSNKETLYPASGDTVLRNVLDYFCGGGVIRVFRLYPAVTSTWSTSNPYGYSDIVAANPETLSYAWNDPAMRRYNFQLEGVEVG